MGRILGGRDRLNAPSLSGLRCAGDVACRDLISTAEKRTKTKSAEGRSSLCMQMQCMVACDGMLIISGVKLKG